MGAERADVTLKTVEPGMPAEKAGLKVGDQILTANGENIPALEALVQMLSRTKDQPLEMVVLRNGEKLTFTVKPVLDPGGSGQGPAYRIGIASNFAPKLKSSISRKL